MSKLKNIQKKYGMLNESFAWERQEGKPLPTLKDVQAAYNARSINEQEDTPVADSKIVSHIDFRKKGGPDLNASLNMYKNKLRKLKRDTRKSDNAAFTIKELSDFHRHMAEFLKIANNALEQQAAPAEEDEGNPFSI
jgi:hypothetical protein